MTAGAVVLPATAFAAADDGWAASVRSYATGVSNGYQLALDQTNGKVYLTDAQWRAETRILGTRESESLGVDWDTATPHANTDRSTDDSSDGGTGDSTDDVSDDSTDGAGAGTSDNAAAGGLPVTGVATAALVAIVALLLGGGTALVVRRRQIAAAHPVE